MSLAEQTAILARSDQQYTNAQEARYTDVVKAPDASRPGHHWQRLGFVDATTGANTFRFITTHLSSIGSALGPAYSHCR